MSAAATLPSFFRLLSDPIRLRVLGLLCREELGVGELGHILALSPSRLGNHLRQLREAGLVHDRREGTWTFVRLHREGAPRELWAAVETELERSFSLPQDLKRLEEVLEERRSRSRAYFDRVAPEWDVIGSDFSTGVGRHRVAASLVPPSLVVADVGCGTGYLAAALAPLVARVILVDHAPAMLERARDNLAGALCALEFRRGEIDALPLADEEVDAVVAGMVLHHAPDPAAFFREAYRVLRPGGVLVVEDMLPHKEAWMREDMADLRLGLEPDVLERKLIEIGFHAPAVERVDDAHIPEHPDGGRVQLPLFVLRAYKGRAGRPEPTRNPPS
jgi:ArsR family transcriptional regulator